MAILASDYYCVTIRKPIKYNQEHSGQSLTSDAELACADPDHVENRGTTAGKIILGLTVSRRMAWTRGPAGRVKVLYIAKAAVFRDPEGIDRSIRYTVTEDLS